MQELLASLLVALYTISPTTELGGNVKAALLREEVKKSTVLIVLFNNCGDTCGTENVVGRASGVMITPKGQVVTNRHAITVGDGSTVDHITIVPTGTDEVADLDCAYDATPSSISEKYDIAFLQPSGPIPCGEGHFMLPREYVSPTGTDIQIIGYPSIGPGMPSLTVTNGQVSGRLYENDAVSYLKTDAKVISGVSGGAVIDDRGNLIGIATGRTYVSKDDGSIDEMEEQLGLIIPSFTIWDAVAEASGEDFVRPAAMSETSVLLSGISPGTWMIIQSTPFVLIAIILGIVFIRMRKKNVRQGS